MTDERLPKQTTEWPLENRRKRGKPKNLEGRNKESKFQEGQREDKNRWGIEIEQRH